MLFSKSFTQSTSYPCFLQRSRSQKLRKRVKFEEMTEETKLNFKYWTHTQHVYWLSRDIVKENSRLVSGKTCVVRRFHACDAIMPVLLQVNGICFCLILWWRHVVTTLIQAAASVVVICWRLHMAEVLVIYSQMDSRPALVREIMEVHHVAIIISIILLFSSNLPELFQHSIAVSRVTKQSRIVGIMRIFIVLNVIRVLSAIKYLHAATIWKLIAKSSMLIRKIFSIRILYICDLW